MFKKWMVFAVAAGFVLGCDDGGSNNNPEIPIGELISICSDELDNDGNSQIDCADLAKCSKAPICKDGARVLVENDESLCKDGYDNDLNGQSDCADANCQVFEYCKSVEAENTLERCKDKVDNDKDGKTDCDDQDCASFEHCKVAEKVENTQVLCSDGIDNDEDGKSDCDDPDCKVFAHCSLNDKRGENTLELCTDKTDNDGDGKVDCQDSECSTFEHCLGLAVNNEKSEADCKDGKDNDGDGVIDCAEAACQSHSFCSDECPQDPFKFKKDSCACGYTLMPDGTCAKNISNLSELRSYTGSYSEDAILKLDVHVGRITDWKPIGNEQNPYKAKFYGGSKRISGELQCVTGTEYCGLFGKAQNASFSDLDLSVTLSNSRENARNVVGGLVAWGESVIIQNIILPAKVYAKVKITKSTETSCDMAAISGALAGILQQGSEVNNVTATGAASAEAILKNEAIAGGLVGVLSSSNMKKLKVKQSVTAYLNVLTNQASSPCDITKAGGIVGSFEAGTIEDVEYDVSVRAYLSGNPTSTSGEFSVYAGGVAGEMKAGLLKKLHGVGSVESGPDASSTARYVGAGAAVGKLTKGNIDIASFKGTIIAKVTQKLNTYKSATACAGGIVGQAECKNDDICGISNVEANSKIVSQSIAESRAGGILGYGFNVNLSNAVAKTQFESYNLATAQNYLGGLIGYASRCKIVNTYAKLHVLIPEGTETNPVIPPTLGALVSYGSDTFLYESYWTKEDFIAAVVDSIVKIVVGSTLVDATCKEYVTTSNIPEVGTDKLLQLLRQNLGLDSGVVSVQIPYGKYLPWKEKVENGVTWPSLDFAATNLVEAGLF